MADSDVRVVDAHLRIQFLGRDAMQPMLPNYSMVASDPKCAQRCLLLEATRTSWHSDLDSESESEVAFSGSALYEDASGKDSESQTPTRSRRRGFPVDLPLMVFFYPRRAENRTFRPPVTQKQNPF
jgi:hypothetical protein